MRDPIGLISQVATVALIASATRWLWSAKGGLSPKKHEGSSVYLVREQFRALGIVGTAFWIIVSAWSWYDLHRPDWSLIAIAGLFALMGLWLASGKVTTDEKGITKKGLWLSRSFQWSEVSGIRLHKRQGGAIELLAGSRNLFIDSRFVAFEQLLREVEARTNLKPTSAR